MGGLMVRPREIVCRVRSDVDAVTGTEAKIAALVKSIEELALCVTNANAENFQYVNANGGDKRRSQTIAADYFVASADGAIYADTSGGNVQATLPKASEYIGAVITLKRQVAGNTFTIVPWTGDTIAGGASITVTTAVRYESDGVSDWRLTA